MTPSKKKTAHATGTSHPGAGLPLASRTTRASRKALPTCDATTRDGTPCGNAAGKRTDHPGLGRCYLHGGVGQKPEAKHAIIETTDSRLGDLIEAYSNDPNLLDLRADVALLRALVARHIERHDAREAALLAWHGAWGGAYIKKRDEWRAQLPLLFMAQTPVEEWPEPPHPDQFASKPMQLPDISDVYKLIDRVGAMAQRVSDMQKGRMVSLDTFARMLPKVGLALIEATREVQLDEDVRTALLRAFERRVDAIEPEPELAAAAGSLAGDRGGAGRTVN